MFERLRAQAVLVLVSMKNVIENSDPTRTSLKSSPYTCS